MIGTLFESALASGVDVEIEEASGRRVPLPVRTWAARPTRADLALVDRCFGATLDIGCGPGRFVAELAARRIPALGIDITPAAVASTRARGGLALERDVFGPLPGAGRWQTALLADGNVGIGGDPVRLLRRVSALLGPHGQALVELSGPGPGRGTFAVRLRTTNAYGSWFRWAEVGAAEIQDLADQSRMTLAEVWTEQHRWFACLS
jgi:SAM-dependent methyltransferase